MTSSILQPAAAHVLIIKEEKLRLHKKETAALRVSCVNCLSSLHGTLDFSTLCRDGQLPGEGGGWSQSPGDIKNMSGGRSGPGGMEGWREGVGIKKEGMLWSSVLNCYIL